MARDSTEIFCASAWAVGSYLGDEGQIAFRVAPAVALVLGSRFLEHLGAVGQYMKARADLHAVTRAPST